MVGGRKLGVSAQDFTHPYISENRAYSQESGEIICRGTSLDRATMAVNPGRTSCSDSW